MASNDMATLPLASKDSVAPVDWKRVEFAKFPRGCRTPTGYSPLGGRRTRPWPLFRANSACRQPWLSVRVAACQKTSKTMNAIETALIHGVGFGDVTLLAIRASVGGFFTVSGAHKLFNPTRRRGLKATFAADGVTFGPMMYLVPLGEFLGGLGVAFGALTIFAVVGLVVLSLGATRLDGLKRIASMHPLDPADRLGDVLYLPEVLYVLCLLPVLSFGPGAYSLDALVWR
jgi:uncharacterized membrane protein YphA (DoxX/SURF4 family)